MTPLNQILCNKMDHKNLDVWKKGIDLAAIIYKISSGFPGEERFGLSSQIRRAAVSVPSTIAEGSARKSNKELLQFISVALGSLAEVETQYIIAVRLKYTLESKEVLDLITIQRKLLLGYRNHIRKHND